MKVWWRYNNSDMNGRHLCMKILEKHNKINECSIYCSCIWHVNTPLCVYWLDTHSVNIWWRYKLPNINAIHFTFDDISLFTTTQFTATSGMIFSKTCKNLHLYSNCHCHVNELSSIRFSHMSKFRYAIRRGRQLNVY